MPRFPLLSRVKLKSGVTGTVGTAVEFVFTKRIKFIKFKLDVLSPPKPISIN